MLLLPLEYKRVLSCGLYEAYEDNDTTRRTYNFSAYRKYLELHMLILKLNLAMMRILEMFNKSLGINYVAHASPNGDAKKIICQKQHQLHIIYQ